MADKVIVSKSKLTAIGDAIRSKTGKTDSMTLDTMSTAITNISSSSGGGGGGNTESCEVTVSRISSPMNTEYVLYYTTPSLEIATLTAPAEGFTATIYCAKNTIIALKNYPGLSSVGGSITRLLSVNFCVTGSGYINLE